MATRFIVGKTYNVNADLPDAYQLKVTGIAGNWIQGDKSVLNVPGVETINVPIALLTTATPAN